MKFGVSRMKQMIRTLGYLQGAAGKTEENTLVDSTQDSCPNYSFFHELKCYFK